MDDGEKDGLKIQVMPKKPVVSAPLVTVITVVYNGVKEIEKTILSVLEQDYDNVEYIIIDGGSTDGTLDIIKKYKDKIDYWISEKDLGIYDAMNKGTALSSGKWLNFMNAGDNFADSHVIKKIFSRPEITGADIIYGNVRINYINYPALKDQVIRPGKPDNLWQGTQIFHQSSFALRDRCREMPFNNENLAADFEFFYKNYLRNSSFYYIDLIISEFASGGISERKKYKSFFECFKTVYRNPLTRKPKPVVAAFYFYVFIGVLIKDFLKMILPRKLLLPLMSINNRFRYL